MSHHLHASINSLYLLLLGVAIGAILALGVFVAPVIFKASSYLSALEITKFHSGILMTQIFIKSCTLLNLTAFTIALYELIALRLGDSRPVFALLGILSIGLILLFTLYYTPYIIEAQNIGVSATSSDTFIAVHKQSEVVFKLLFIMLSLLFGMRIFALYRA